MLVNHLTQRLKALLSIRAVLRTAGITESYFYPAACRQRPLKAEAVGPIASALRETANELASIADSLEASS